MKGRESEEKVGIIFITYGLFHDTVSSNQERGALTGATG
jgi:hypothetical protein